MQFVLTQTKIWIYNEYLQKVFCIGKGDPVQINIISNEINYIPELSKFF